MLNRIQHGVNLPRFCLGLIILVAITATIHANQLDNFESNEALPDQLEHQREGKKTGSTNQARHNSHDLNPIKHNRVDINSAIKKFTKNYKHFLKFN